MAQELHLKAAGLYSHPSPLSEVPEGALERADNVVCPADGQVETRRGQAPLTAFAGTPTSLADFGGQVVAHTTAGLERHDGTSPATLAAGLAAPADFRMRFMEAARSLFLTTSAGVRRLETVTGAAVAAGLPRCPDILAVAPSVGASASLPPGCAVAYRVVLGYRDAYGRLFLSAPSGPRVFTNTSGAGVDPAVVAWLPAGLSTSHFVQVYRTKQRPTSAGHPGDSMQLVWESFLTTTNLSNRFVDPIDNVPDDLRGAALYTNETQEGAAMANLPPPLARDVSQFAGCAFYFNTQRPHGLTVRLLGVGAPNGLQAGDTVTVGGVVFTAVVGPPGAGQFQLSTIGTPSANIEATVNNLIGRLNNPTTGSPVAAYYASGPDDAPGSFQMESSTLGGAAFTFTSSRPTAWAQALPLTSDNDANPAGLYWSKPGQPDAVPLPYNTTVGNRGSAGLRMVALRDALFLFKEDGVFRLTGSSPADFSVTLLDPTVRLLAPQSVVALANQAFALTDQGVVAVSDTGAAVLSRPIEGELQDALAAAGAAKVRELAFGVAYETERTFLLWLPETEDATRCTLAYVYNVATGTWTRRTDAAGCGHVPRHDDRLHLGDTTHGNLTRERKTRTDDDYEDGDGEVVEAAVTWTVRTGGNPGASKHYREVQFITERPTTAATVALTTDWSPEEETVEWTQPGLLPLPLPVALGGGEGLARPVRVTVPTRKGRCTQLSVGLRHGVLGEPLVLQGLSLMFNPMGERTGR